MRIVGPLTVALSLMISATPFQGVFSMEESHSLKKDPVPTQSVQSSNSDSSTPEPTNPAAVKQTGDMVETKALPAETEKATPAADATPPAEALKEKRIGSPKFALSLAGGGARGAAHVGVLKVLEAEGLRPDFIAGSSAGAMIGGLYAAGVPAAKIEELMLNPKFKRAFFPRPEYIQASLYLPRYAFLRAIGVKPLIGLYSGKSI